MPVNFKGTSEYDRNFHWLPSRKSASYVPTSQEDSAAAGKPSTKIAIQTEPPLQSKKRPATVNIASSGDHAQEEYALLGKHEKFATNIRYRTKSKEPPLAKTYKVPVSMENGHESEHVNGTSAGKTSHHHHKVRRGRSSVKLSQSSVQPAQPSQKQHTTQQDIGAGDGNAHIVTPLAPREEKFTSKTDAKKPNEYKKKRESVQQPKPSRSPKRSKSATTQAQPEKRTEEAENPHSEPPTKPPASHSLKYKAGIAAPKHSKTRLSEYQLQFKWQNPVKSSPLLDAEQVVYSTNGPLPPFKSDPVPKFTEYRSQFKPYKYKSRVTSAKEEKHGKMEKIKRSKSEGALHKKVEETCKPDAEKQKVLLARDPQQPKFPHGKHRRYKTEYEVNFKAPMNYEYVDGAWKGAHPAHVITDLETTMEPAGVNETPSTWFWEVMELRKKAEEYKLRARGTHFSKEHLAQLYAKQADCWDAASTVSTTLSALALDKPRARPASKKFVTSETPGSVSEVASTITGSVVHLKKKEEIPDSVQTKLAWAEEDDDETPRENASLIPSTGRSTTVTARSTSTVKTVESVGRIPTPKMSTGTSNQTKSRHHLDRTTPAVGGALLSSPPQAPSSSRSGSVVPVAKENKTVVPSAVQISSSEAMRTPRRQKLIGPSVDASPTYGKPTMDTHLLINEEISHDEPIITKFTQSPVQNKVESKKKIKKDRIRPAGIPSTINENMANTYNKQQSLLPQPWDIDWRLKQRSQTKNGDDILSVSVQSIASSCSLASEVLERARARRDDFWGNPDDHTGR